MELNEKELKRLEEELLTDDMPGKKSAMQTFRKTNRAIRNNIPLWVIPVAVCSLICIIAFTGIIKLLFPSQPKPVPQGTLEGLDAYMENDSAQTQEVAARDESAEEEIKGEYFATPSIQSAFPEDYLVQIGSTVFQLPIRVSELEVYGIRLTKLGNKVPDESVVLAPGLRSGYITLDRYQYIVAVTNSVDCSYKDLYVTAVYVAENKTDTTGFYAFGGICIGTEETLLPPNHTEFKVNDFAAVNTYIYGEKLGLGKGSYTEVLCKGNKVMSIRVANDSLESIP